MKDRLSQGLELAVQSVNYVLITYALSNLAMLMRRNWLYILFFASEIWLTQQYWTKVRELTGSKILSGLLLLAGWLVPWCPSRQKPERKFPYRFTISDKQKFPLPETPAGGLFCLQL